MIIQNPTLKAQMKTSNCLSSDSSSDIDVDNAEEHKEQSISKHEQIDRKTFSYYSPNDHYIIMLLKYTKQGNFHGLKEKPGLSLIITRHLENLMKITEKATAGLKEKLSMSMSNIFSVKFIIGSLSAKNVWTLIKSEFNIDDGRTRIVEILKGNGYKYRSPKLNIKMNYNTEIWD